jgi:SAM-dependent methyltransferase
MRTTTGRKAELTTTSSSARRSAKPERSAKVDTAEGWHGWDEYAAFYDWENARTVGRRDVAFWRGIARRVGGRTLELGCGTGRVLLPLARAGVEIVGIDRSVPMLARAHARLRRARRPLEASLVRGDIRQLPFAGASRVASSGALPDTNARAASESPSTQSRASGAAGGPFDLVIAPYGILQSLVRDRDLTDTLRAVARVLAPGGKFGLDLVPDVPRWQEYSRRVSLQAVRGPRGEPLTLIESVRQDRARRLTMFDQEFVEGRGTNRQSYRFSLTFRTVGIRPLCRRLERAGFRIDGVLGSYDGAAWDPRADVWVILASKV